MNPMESSEGSVIPMLWTVKDVAAYLKVKESTIRNWVHIGYIPHIKFRGAVRFREPDIVEWLDRCAAPCRTSPSDYASRILRERR
jgi:excisionase family DNA binding protein